MLVMCLLTACATSTGNNGRFIANDVGIAASPERVRKLEGYWDDGALMALRESGSSRADHRWILNFIAQVESSGPAPCTHLRLTEVVKEPLSSFSVLDHVGSRKQYSPRKYLETWRVDSCGSTHRWRVLDDPSTPANELTVLLYQKS